MSLTRKFLKTLELTDDAIERIVEAHAETVEALKRERDEASARATAAEAAADEREARAVSEMTAYRTQVEAERTQARKRQAVLRALREAGVQREAFAELLSGSVDLNQVTLDGDRLVDAEALLAPLRARYGVCFAQPQTQGTPPCAPPLSGAPRLSREQVLAMTPEEINDNWSAVQAAIGQK